MSRPRLRCGARRSGRAAPIGMLVVALFVALRSTPARADTIQANADYQSCVSLASGMTPCTTLCVAHAPWTRARLRLARRRAIADADRARARAHAHSGLMAARASTRAPTADT